MKWSVVLTAAFAVVGLLWQFKRSAARWGATDEEVAHSWPGDELSPEATSVTTRAITIDAAPKVVWSWLIQIGQDRAGFYSYTWLENLFGLVMPRVERLVPEWQQRIVGDMVWLARRDRYRGNARQIVVRLNRFSVLTLASPEDWGRLVRRETSLGGTWTFILVPVDTRQTRLIVRSRGPEAPSPVARFFRLGVFAPAHFIMERRMMLHLKDLAESEPVFDVELAS